MQRFKPGQLYLNTKTKSVILILDFPKVRRIACRRGGYKVPHTFNAGIRPLEHWVHIGNNYNSITRVDVTTMSDTDPRFAVVKTMTSIVDRVVDDAVTAGPIVPPTRYWPTAQEMPWTPVQDPQPLHGGRQGVAEGLETAFATIRQHEKTIETLKRNQHNMESLMLDVRRMCVDVVTVFPTNDCLKARAKEVYKAIVSFGFVKK